MNNGNQIVIHGELIKNIRDFHLAMKHSFNLPDYYGDNLDALWDCLTTWIETPVEVIWVNFEDSRNSLGNYSKIITDLFGEAQKEINGFSILYR